MNSRQRRKTTERLAAYLEGEVTPSERQAIEKALADDPEQRKYLAQLLRIRTALASPVAPLEGLDLVARVRQQASAPAPRKSNNIAAWAWTATAGTALAAGLALYIGGSSDVAPTAASEFQARGAETSTPTQWAGLQSYRVDASNSRALPLTTRMSSADGLLFSYTNLGEHPFSHLAVFGVDDAGEVFWYHPAYLDAKTDPESIPIDGGAAQQPLNAVVRHTYTSKSLEIYAVFSHRPWRVSELEAWVKHANVEAPQLLASAQPLAPAQPGSRLTSERGLATQLQGSWVERLTVEVSREGP